MRPSLLARASLPLVLLLAGCAYSGEAGTIGTATGFNVTRIEPGDRTGAPEVAGEPVRPGPAITAALLEGKVGVVNFFGSWCGPCRLEERALESLWREYRPRGVRFVGVNSRRDQRAAAIAFLDEFDVTYPAVYDPSSRIAHKFRVLFMPATFVIDRQGRVAARIVGALRNEADLRVLLDQELAA